MHFRQWSCSSDMICVHTRTMTVCFTVMNCLQIYRRCSKPLIQPRFRLVGAWLARTATILAHAMVKSGMKQLAKTSGVEVLTGLDVLLRLGTGTGRERTCRTDPLGFQHEQIGKRVSLV